LTAGVDLLDQVRIVDDVRLARYTNQFCSEVFASPSSRRSPPAAAMKTPGGGHMSTNGRTPVAVASSTRSSTVIPRFAFQIRSTVLSLRSGPKALKGALVRAFTFVLRVFD